jgi:hypothetical protein
VSLPESDFDRPRGVLVRRERATIYTVLLFISLVALLISCAIMALELLHYDLQTAPNKSIFSFGSYAPAAVEVKITGIV